MPFRLDVPLKVLKMAPGRCSLPRGLRYEEHLVDLDGVAPLLYAEGLAPHHLAAAPHLHHEVPQVRIGAVVVQRVAQELHMVPHLSAL